MSQAPSGFESEVIRLFRSNQGGVGSFLSNEQKEQIKHGRKNAAENSSLYCPEKLNKAADDFFAAHPFEMLERQK